MTFNLLHPKVQAIIAQMQWTNFKPIQDDSIQHIIYQDTDLLIVAPTAGGKTEAAFLPVISKILNKEKPSVRILYISPLKALINDQFSRVLELCKLSNISVTKWHGDANYSQKQKLIASPSGIILITPESLEALFVNRYERLQSMFKYLDYIIIDEIHSFVSNERGTQLNSLINRLQYLLSKTIQKIALSATLNDEGKKDILSWLSNCSNHQAEVISDKDNRGIQGIIKSYVKELDDKDISIETALKSDLLKILNQKKSLIFANTKGILEEYCDDLMNRVQQQQISLVINIHHGSLSKEIREHTEQKLLKNKNIAVFCTNTLELGIDVGDIDQIIFLNAPFSVSSLAQRLGRSGRQVDSKRIFSFYLETELSHDIEIVLQIELLQSIAIVELMLEEWYEPFKQLYDYSTLTQQLLSFLSATGGNNPIKLYEYLIKICKFSSDMLSEQDFILLLKELKQHGIIYQDTSNNITLDKKGERLAEHYTFYAAFFTTSEWKIVYNGKDIGSLPAMPLKKQFLLSGKRWEILNIQEQQKIIQVMPSKIKGETPLGGAIPNIHEKIHEKMLEIYQSEYTPKYLDPQSQELLKQACKQYEYLNKKDSSVIFIFSGSIILNTFSLLLDYLNIPHISCGIAVNIFQDKQEVIKQLKSLSFDTISEFDLVQSIKREKKESRKYDYLIPDILLDRSYSKEWIDLKGVKNSIKSL